MHQHASRTWWIWWCYYHHRHKKSSDFNRFRSPGPPGPNFNLSNNGGPWCRTAIHFHTVSTATAPTGHVEAICTPIVWKCSCFRFPCFPCFGGHFFSVVLIYTFVPKLDKKITLSHEYHWTDTVISCFDAINWTREIQGGNDLYNWTMSVRSVIHKTAAR